MLSDILTGLTAGQPQAVGNMSIVPLIGPDSEYTDVGSPSDIRVDGDTRYDSLHLGTDSKFVTIVPNGITYITKERAQDRTVPSTHLVKSVKEVPVFCVQSSQSGHMSRDQDSKRQLRLLPHPIRYLAYRKRNDHGYNQLWDSLGKFNRSLRIDGDFLISFFEKFATQLTEFVAEFELVPQQRGAIILINDEVAGIELSPSHATFAEMWEPMIRDCYGSYAIVLGDKAEPDQSQILGGISSQGFCRDVVSLDELVESVAALEEREKEYIKKLVSDILEEEESLTETESVAELHLFDVSTKTYIGQVVRTKDSDGFIYASLMSKPLTDRRFSWN